MKILTNALAVATSILVSVWTGPASAQQAPEHDYPRSAITMIVPFPAGGSDAVPRKLAQKVSESIGQPIVVVNRPGASGLIAAKAVLDSKSDGYTIYVASPTELATNPFLFENVPFDALRDFSPISKLAETPFVLFSRKDLPINSYKELIAFLKANPGKANFGTFGPGSPPDLLARKLMMLEGVDFTLVPYKGGAQMLVDLAGGKIDLGFATLIPTKPLIQSNRIKPIAVTLKSRAKAIPDTPTFSEMNVDLTDGGAWLLMGPKELPSQIISLLREKFVEALRQPDVRSMLDDSSIVPVGSTPAELSRSLAEDTQRWGQLIPKFGLGKAQAN